VFQARSSEIASAPAAIRTVDHDGWIQVDSVVPTLADRRILLPVPPRFLEMQQNATVVALAWRLALREVMTDVLARGYTAVDFFLDRARGGGAYLFARELDL
jgi:predicted GNAT superfamily acetyltransferase